MTLDESIRDRITTLFPKFGSLDGNGGIRKECLHTVHVEPSHPLPLERTLACLRKLNLKCAKVGSTNGIVEEIPKLGLPLSGDRRKRGLTPITKRMAFGNFQHHVTFGYRR